VRFNRRNSPHLEPPPPPLPRHRAVSELRDIVDELGDVIARATAASTPQHSGRLLGSLLVTRGFLVQEELERLLAVQKTTGQRLGDIVLELHLVSEQNLVELIAEQLRLELFDPSRFVVDMHTARQLPELHARRLRAVPIRNLYASVAVAVADPTTPELVAQLVRHLGVPVRLYIATRPVIEQLINRVYQED
jgi:hypothetical protein